MARLLWDQVGEKTYETGTKQGVLYLQDSRGNYNNGVAWNGLTSVSESPDGGDANDIYASFCVALRTSAAPSRPIPILPSLRNATAAPRCLPV